ncbi:hypothetical protein SKAU_G00125580 [Synaphobranchus kaupii]|uniref:Uncharacterized protein n=1 Tax=Synaphobranchus kaupii TaxID=118154 RepID=A0A9Q1FPJ1_SYNKA|nr:hypothetical protein SKAU_G00125580 [Synaphobranchus kaupii]
MNHTENPRHPSPASEHLGPAYVTCAVKKKREERSGGKVQPLEGQGHRQSASGVPAELPARPLMAGRCFTPLPLSSRLRSTPGPGVALPGLLYCAGRCLCFLHRDACLNRSAERWRK